MKNLKIILPKADIAFKISFLILAIITFNIFTSRTAIAQYYTYCVFAFGILLVLLRLLFFKEYRKTKGLIFLVIFYFSAILSSVLNYKYGGLSVLVSNAKGLIWMMFFFFIMYAYNSSDSVHKTLKELRIFSLFILFYNFLAVIVSIVMVIINFRLLIVRGEHTILGGFIWNRLWGVYTDPNHGAVLSAVCILLSLYYFIKVKRRTYRIFNIVNIFLSLTYISSSDSRTGIVALAAGIAVFVYLFAIRKQLTFIKTKWIKCLFCIFISATIAVISIFTVVAQKYAVSETRKLFLSSSNTISQEEIEIGREDDLVDDVSNRRFSIWKSGSELFLKTPIIGTSFRGIVAFAEKVLPNTYLINNNAGKFDCMHNSVFDILVSQGLLGFLAFLSFAITIFVSFFKGLANIKEPGKYLLISSLFAFIILISVSSLFLSEIIYINSIGAVIFWGFLGYAMKFLCVISNEGKIYADNYSNNSRI